MTTRPLPTAAHGHAAHGHASHDASGEQPDHAGMLDLDARVVGHLDELTAWVRGLAPCAPRTVVDVGAGSGTGTFALARRFPHASLVAVDSSPAALAHLRATAFGLDLATRVRTVQADLDRAWPDVHDVDLAWAASSLHHLADPGRVLRDVRDALVPGGTVAVVESDGMPRFLPEDLGYGEPGLEDRLRAVTVRRGWNAWSDWAPHLGRAGLEVLERRTVDVRVDPAPAAAHRYAHLVLAGMRHRLADDLTPDDVRTLDRLLDDRAEGSLARRRDLVVRSTRTAWAARRA